MLAGYAVVSLAVFGTLTPVSGQAKSLGAPFLNLDLLCRSCGRAPGGSGTLWLGAATIVLLAAVVAAGAGRRTARDRVLLRCAVAIAAGQAALLAYVVVGTSYPIWAWYLYGLALVAFSPGRVAGRLVEARGRGRVVALGVGLAAAFAAAQVPVLFGSGYTHGPASLATARFIDEELPPGAVLAMGDRAGLVGYLGNRPVLQLEGLVADARWLDDLEGGTASPA